MRNVGFTPSYTVAGTLTDAEGKPIEAARVEAVLKDKDEFISKLEKRIIYGVADRQYLGELKNNYDYQLGLKNIVKALEITSKKI